MACLYVYILSVAAFELQGRVESLRQKLRQSHLHLTRDTNASLLFSALLIIVPWHVSMDCALCQGLHTSLRVAGSDLNSNVPCEDSLSSGILILSPLTSGVGSFSARGVLCPVGC